MVFQRSMLDWRRGGVCLHWCLCIHLYVKCSWCSGLPEIYGQLEEEVGSDCTGVVVCHASMVDWRRQQGQSVMKIMWCNGLPELHALLLGGPSAKVGSSAKYEHTSKFTLASQRSFLQKTNKIHI